MANTDNTIKTTVILDVNEAEREVIKLNATASDSTQELDDRIQAKNKSVEISNELSEDKIKLLEDEIKTLKSSGASSKDIEKTQKKLNAAKLKATRTTAANEKALNKLTATQKKSKNAMANLDKATGGLVGKFKLLLANPIGVLLAAIVGAFQLLKTAINSTEDGAAKFNAIMAGLGQIFTNLITLLSGALQPALDWLIKAFTEYLSPALESVSVFADAAKLAFAGLVDLFTLALTPIKAIIAGIKALVAYKEGGLGAAKEVMKDFGNEVKDTAVSMKDNFVGAVKETRKAIEELPAAFEEAKNSSDSLLNSAVEIELWQNRFNKAKRETALLNAKLSTQAKEELAKSKDLTLSWAEREAALNGFIEAEKARNANQKAVLDEEIALQQARMALGGNQIQDEEALNNLLIQREGLNASLADQERQYFRRQTEFINNRIAEEKAFNAQKKQEQDDDLAALDEELAATTAMLDEELAAYEDNARAKAQLDAAELARKKTINERILDNSLSIIGSIFGENKAVAASLATIDAIRGASSAFAATPGGIFVKSLAAAAALAAGYAQVKNILKVKAPSGTSSRGSSGGGTPPATPSVRSFAPETMSNVDSVSGLNSQRNESSLSTSTEQAAATNVAATTAAPVVFSESSYKEFQTQVTFKEERSSLDG